MEGAPTTKTEGNIEQLSDWRELKEKAPEQAENKIDAIAGFDAMEHTQQVEALKDLLDELNQDNTNRFIADVVAHRVSFMTEVARNVAEMERLGVANDNAIPLKQVG